MHGDVIRRHADELTFELHLCWEQCKENVVTVQFFHLYHDTAMSHTVGQMYLFYVLS